MAWIPTTPENRSVHGPKVTKAIDRFKIYDLQVIDSEPSCRMTIHEGYEEDGVFVAITIREVFVPDDKYPGTGVAELVASMAAAADGTKSRRDNIREGVYEMLLALGELPEGTVS